MSKLKELLKKLGLNDEAINTVTAENADFDTAEIAAAAMSNLQQALRNDDGFIGPLRQEFAGQLLGGRERELLRLAQGVVSNEDMEKLPKKDRFDALMKLTIERLKASKNGGEGDADKDKEIQRLNQLIAERDAEVKRLREEEVPAALRKAEEVEDNFYIQHHIAQAATKGGRKTVLDADIVTKLLVGDIASEYDLKRDRSTGKILLRQKGKDLDVYDENDRTKPLSVEDVVTRIGERKGYFVLNNGKGDDVRKDIRTNDTGSSVKYQLPGLKKAQAAVQQA
jgi:hypothetical protein